MNILKKIFLRLYKHIEIHHPKNISFGENNFLSNGSIINANQGTIILGKNTRIGKNSELVAAKNTKLEIKDFTTLYSNCKILGNITIERYCVLATNIYMSSGNHFAFEHPELLIRTQDKIVREQQEDINKPIHIHEDVWIGNGVFISAGLTIGRGAVIGAGSVITKSISPYKVVVGNPGKPIKTRLDFNPPSMINANNQKDWPYFYQGFDHKNAFPNLPKHGFQLIDSGQIFLANNGSSIKIIGHCITNTQIELSVDRAKQSYDVTQGEFTLILELNTKTQTKNLIISIYSKNRSSKVYIKSAQVKTL